MKTHYEMKVSLDLNEKWEIFPRNELKQWALENPNPQKRSPRGLLFSAVSR